VLLFQCVIYIPIQCSWLHLQGPAGESMPLKTLSQCGRIFDDAFLINRN
jgi:hypothetical protein